MKEKQFIEVENTNESLDDLYEQYVIYTKMESDLKKKKASIKEKLSSFFDNEGCSDDFGNVWLQTRNGRFKKEIRKKYSIDPIFADPILRRLGLYDKVVTFEPVYDVDVLQNYIADGTVSEDEVSKMFKVTESYAVRAETSKEKAEETQEKIPE